MKLDDIDFAAMYREQMQRAAGAPRPATAWGSRATEYGRNSGRSRCVEDFIAHAWTWPVRGRCSTWAADQERWRCAASMSAQ